MHTHGTTEADEDAEVERLLEQWDEREKTELDLFERAWNAHAALIRRRNRRVTLLTERRAWLRRMFVHAATA